MLGPFLRTTIISLSKAGWARSMVTKWGFARRAASRFVAGDTVDEALKVIQLLNEHGINTTLDFLGESTTNAQEARAAADEVIHALEAIDRAMVRSNVSIKLSQMGLTIDEALCRENLRRILQRAKELNTFVRIDMEESALVDRTIDTWDWSRSQGFDNVGLVMQSSLYRASKDIDHILERGGRVRLVKGAYQEPAWVAFPKKADVDANYDKLATCLLEGEIKAGLPPISTDGRVPPIPAIATHDEARIKYAQEEIRRLKLPKSAVEFQMLYGIRRDLQDRLVEQGFPVRVYVPYGTYWYPYFMRRLAERPANLWFFISNYFRR